MTECKHIYGIFVVDADHDDDTKPVGYLVDNNDTLADDDVLFCFCPICGEKLVGITNG